MLKTLVSNPKQALKHCIEGNKILQTIHYLNGILIFYGVFNRLSSHVKWKVVKLPFRAAGKKFQSFRAWILDKDLWACGGLNERDEPYSAASACQVHLSSSIVSWLYWNTCQTLMTRLKILTRSLTWITIIWCCVSQRCKQKLRNRLREWVM
jgi:hypothetical protein